MKEQSVTYKDLFDPEWRSREKEFVSRFLQAIQGEKKCHYPKCKCNQPDDCVLPRERA